MRGGAPGAVGRPARGGTAGTQRCDWYAEVRPKVQAGARWNGGRTPPRPPVAPGHPGVTVTGHTSRRAVAHLVSSCRLESCNFRSTAETWDSTVFTEMNSCLAISLYA